MCKILNSALEIWDAKEDMAGVDTTMARARGENAHHGNTLAVSRCYPSRPCVYRPSRIRARKWRLGQASLAVARKTGKRAVQVLGPPVLSQVSSSWWWYKLEFDSADWASGVNETGAARYVGLVANGNKIR